ncbi:MAG: B12-binding domain-containing radical SAM protein [Lachnospiraceae bacterium]|nr:B12-binding domain-containing radical SAM protein [Lachnospiraceae bacterium]
MERIRGILLLGINAKYIHTNLALYSLRQYAVQAAGERGDFYREHIFLREYTINHRVEEILRGIYKVRPRVLCISCYLWNIRMVKELVEDYKKIDPDVHIYLGGPEVSYDATKCLATLPAVNGVMVGEGEGTFYELARAYLEGDALVGGEFQAGVEIRSLVYRGKEGGIHTNPIREMLNFSSIPFPYADCLDFADFTHKIIYYETSRGCPFSCCYCLSSVEKSLRLRDLSLVEGELKAFLDARVAQVKFVDRTFNCNRAHAMHIWNYLLEHDNGVTNFHFEIAADLLDEEQIALLGRMRPGLIQLEIGVQSTNPRTLAAIFRRTDLKKVAEYVGRVQKPRNIHQHLDLIAGLPYEDYTSFGKSFDDVYHMKPDQLQLGFLKILKGSAMAAMVEEHGILFGSKPPYEVLCTKYLPYSDVLRLKDIEDMVEVYYNSGQFVCSLPYLSTQFKSPFSMFEELALFYREEGLFDVKHSRLSRYEILYRFAQGKTAFGDFLPCFAECLLFDYYSREKPKAQPSFARAKDCDKRQRREIFVAFGIEGEQAARCYVAYFCYDMEAAGEGRTVRCGADYLFDYTVGDPLTGACKVRCSTRK